MIKVRVVMRSPRAFYIQVRKFFFFWKDVDRCVDEERAIEYAKAHAVQVNRPKVRWESEA